MNLVARIAAAAIAALTAVSASAFTLEPMTALLAPSGAGSVGTFRVKNDGSARIAIKLSAATRSVDLQGNEINEDASSLFTIYPARLLVEPGATAAVKIQWKGDRTVAAERSFRFIAEQVPVSDAASPPGAGIKMMFKYVASLYVGSDGFKHRIVAKAAGDTGPEGVGFALEITNQGQRHFFVKEASLALTDPEGKTILIGAESLGPALGFNYLPGFPRRLFVPDGRAVPGTEYAAALTYDGDY